MSNKPRINQLLHAEAYPKKLAVYKCGDGKAWFVDRGWANLDQFDTFEEALTYALEVDKCAST